MSDQPDSSALEVLRRYAVGRPQRGRTTEAVSEALREAILDGALAPSTWLREDEVAAVLEVSRTPVREALRRVADEGLAVKVAHHGTVVAPMKLEDILALYVVRENLEGMATRLATIHQQPGLIADLESLQEQMTALVNQSEQVAPDAAKRIAALNLKFHGRIRESCGNLYLDRFLFQVEQAVRRLQPTSFSAPGRAQRALDEHIAIIKAIKIGDPAEAEKSAKEHMRNAREIRLSMLLG
ncbi:GntR family transcriptional regulator [Streptomyces sp. NBRC 109706]|uniref:GntR family transcriptional regulator n=1 Tax=Streptomyces sp. NBRC 109706 TaxID=1550035 RepID=UPI000785090E|nr:GntR family transcriptional regulator [Streptomyces sp. NBRC 109706]